MSGQEAELLSSAGDESAAGRMTARLDGDHQLENDAENCAYATEKLVLVACWRELGEVTTKSYTSRVRMFV